MGQSLIIACATDAEILALAPLVASLKDKNPQNDLALLTYREQQSTALLLQDVDQVYIVEDQKIKSFARNTIFSTGHAINVLWQNLLPLRQQHWDELYNFQEDEVSLALASFIPAKTKFGLALGSDHNLDYSSTWCFSSQFTYQGCPLLHREDQIRLMANITQYVAPLKINFDPDNQSLAHEHFATLRHATSGEDRRLVGINLATLPSNITDEHLIKLIELLLDDGTLLPILLGNKDPAILARLKNINQKFMNTLIAIQGQSAALTAAIAELDVLITSGPEYKTLISPHGRTIYINSHPHRLGHAPYLPEDVVLSLQGGDFAENVLHALKNSREKLLAAEHDYAAFQVSFSDEIGIYFQSVTKQPTGQDLGIMIGRYILGKLLHLPVTRHERIFAAAPEVLTDWIQQERIQILETTKTLLAALRSLLRLQDNTKMGQEFTTQLAGLLACGEEEHLASLCCTIFKNQIENIPKAAKEDNIRQIETLLYQLRDHLQISLNLLREMEDHLAELKKDNYRNMVKEHLQEMK